MSEATYTRVYKDFRGVDFTSGRSECDPSRFNYLLNMWRDYHSEQGAAVETAPGYRAATGKGNGGRVNGLHYLPQKGDLTAKIIVHRKDKLYAYDTAESGGLLTLDGEVAIEGIVNEAPSRSILFRDTLYMVDGASYFSVQQSTGGLTTKEVNPYIPITFYNGKPYEQKNMLTDLFNEKYSAPSYEDEITEELHFLVHERTDKLIYFDRENRRHTVLAELKDGSRLRLMPFLRQPKPSEYNEEGWRLSVDLADGNVDAENVDWDRIDSIFIGTAEIDQPVQKTEFFLYEKAMDGMTFEEKNYFLGYLYPTNPGDATEVRVGNGDYAVICSASELADGGTIYGILEVVINNGIEKNGKTISKDTLYELTISGTSYPATFQTVGDMKDALSGNPDFGTSYPGTALDAINGCTLITEFDGRIFLSGNPDLPNSVFYSQRDLTGYNNPFYIGCYNYLNDGTGRTPITAMITTPTQLIILKDSVAQGASIYYHVGVDNTAEDKTVRDLQPRIYPRENGVPGIGCLGMACNFLDDPVFLSPNGVEAIAKATVNLERTVAHRSSYVDGRLINERLRGATSAEWDGYLAILVPGGRMYLADSRQIFSHPHGGAQYEWYFWDDIGVWEGQTNRYVYLTALEAPPETLSGHEIAYKPEESFLPAGADIKTEGEIRYVIEGGCAYPVDTTTEQEGGDFSEATALLSVDGRLLFGCQNGTVCIFNTDRRDENHYIVPEAFTHNGRRYLAGCATCSDACGRTNLTKSTARGTFALATKAFPYTLLSVRVRTNDQPWHECDRVFAGEVDFSHTDFSAFTFNPSNECIAIVREREKRWVEKQLYFVGECFESPFGIISATYNYKVAGKVRMR